MISYHMPYFVSGCLVNGQRENLFFAIADNMDDYAVLFHISTLYGVKIMILHDVESETAIYAHGNEPEFMNSPETYAETPNMPKKEYQIQISETGRLFFTQQTAEEKEMEQKFSESLSVFLIYARKKGVKILPEWKRAGKTEWLNVKSGIAIHLKLKRSARNSEEIKYSAELYSLHNTSDLLNDANNEIIRNFRTKETVFRYLLYIISDAESDEFDWE